MKIKSKIKLFIEAAETPKKLQTISSQLITGLDNI